MTNSNRVSSVESFSKAKGDERSIIIMTAGPLA